MEQEKISICSKVVLVTGGASGIGLATAKLFVNLGARVVIADKNGTVAQLVAAEGGGVIVNTGSYTAQVAIGNRAAYIASNGGVVSLSRAMAVDHAHQGVRANCVAPGTIWSPYFDQMAAQADDPDAMRNELDARAVLGRTGRPEEVAEAIVWLASDKSKFAVGSTLTTDGGSSIW